MNSLPACPRERGGAKRTVECWSAPWRLDRESTAHCSLLTAYCLVSVRPLLTNSNDRRLLVGVLTRPREPLRRRPRAADRRCRPAARQPARRGRPAGPPVFGLPGAGPA